MDFGHQQVVSYTPNKHIDKAQDTSTLLFWKEADAKYSLKGIPYYGNALNLFYHFPSNYPFRFLSSDAIPNELEALDGQQLIKTTFPLQVLDPSENRLINVNGGNIFLNDYQKIKEKQKKANIIIVYEDSPQNRQQLLPWTNSLQQVWEILQRPELKALSFNFASVGYNQSGVSQELPLTPSFTKWLEDVQKKTEQAEGIQANAVQGKAMLAGLTRAAELLASHENENNIVITTVSYTHLTLPTKRIV